MIDHWGLHEWSAFVLCVILGLAWILYAYAMWQAGQLRSDFDRRHDAFDEEE